MTRITLIIAALTGVAGGATAGYLLAHRGTSGIEPPPASAPGAADTPGAGERKVLYWHDPMVPGAKFDKPGKSPFMDMDLVPVYADADDAGPAVRVPSERLAEPRHPPRDRRDGPGCSRGFPRSAASPSTSVTWNSCRRGSRALSRVYT